MRVDLRPIPSFPGYFASAAGEIFALRRGCVNAQGYRVVGIKPASGRTKTVLVHQLVAEAFLGERPSWHEEIRHLDDQKLNNSADNLAWGTRKENAGDAARHGRIRRGSRSNLAKLSEADVDSIRSLIARGLGDATIGDRFGVKRTTVWAIRRGKSWRQKAGEPQCE